MTFSIEHISMCKDYNLYQGKGVKNRHLLVYLFSSNLIFNITVV